MKGTLETPATWLELKGQTQTPLLKEAVFLETSLKCAATLFHRENKPTECTAAEKNLGIHFYKKSTKGTLMRLY